uniref:Uncharacterized protein n=1 Tax=Anguilla anguilla TaxID=7936 RepID=A0A0E9TSM1_ANGAN
MNLGSCTNSKEMLPRQPGSLRMLN